MAERKELKIVFDDTESVLGSYISWDRLFNQLRRSGELKDHEFVASVEVDESGIHYNVCS